MPAQERSSSSITVSHSQKNGSSFTVSLEFVICLNSRYNLIISRLPSSGAPVCLSHTEYRSSGIYLLLNRSISALPSLIVLVGTNDLRPDLQTQIVWQTTHLSSDLHSHLWISGPHARRSPFTRFRFRCLPKRICFFFFFCFILFSKRCPILIISPMYLLRQRVFGLYLRMVSGIFIVDSKCKL